MTTIGIIGFGSFGTFLATRLDSDYKVFAVDEHVLVSDKYKASWREVCSADYVILAIPLSAYQAVLTKIKSKLSDKSVLVDVSSVKEEPIRLIRAQLGPECKFIAMHPLFGPESASSGLSGHKLIFCDSSLSIKATAKIKKCLSGMGLDVIDMSAEDHDKQMATLQALTFFLSRSLNEFGIHNNKLITPSFQKLIDLAELDKKHSDELLQTIWQGNRHAKKVRQKFMQDIQALDKKIG